jgi:hypothetical protein
MSRKEICAMTGDLMSPGNVRFALLAGAAPGGAKPDCTVDEESWLPCRMNPSMSILLSMASQQLALPTSKRVPVRG